MTAAFTGNGSTPCVALHLAFEVGWTYWKLAFTTGPGQQPRPADLEQRCLSFIRQ